MLCLILSAQTNLQLNEGYRKKYKTVCEVKGTKVMNEKETGREEESNIKKEWMSSIK